MYKCVVASTGACLLALAGCVRSPVEAASSASSARILASTTPAAGSTVRSPVEEVRFRFARPARLIELTVNGPDGTMPVMITPAGETTDYSVPVSILDTGAYTVDWRATSAGRDYRGSFSFKAR